MRDGPALVEARWPSRRLAVIGDRDGRSSPGLPRRHRHRPMSSLAVGFSVVCHVRSAAEIGDLEQMRDGAPGCDVDLAAHLAELRRHELEASAA